MKHALIIGNHPIRSNIEAQYESLKYCIETADSFETIPSNVVFDALCVLPNKGSADQDTLQALEDFATKCHETPNGQSNPVCHLMLHDKVTLWLLQTINLYPEINKKLELYAFTLEDQWAKNVLCGLSKSNAVYPPLDREKIDAASNKTVHLVIVGFSDLSESLALHAALVAHFPNYERNHALRTRITILDEGMTTKRDAFIQRYANLFEHSYYRCIDLKQRCMTYYHEPLYCSSRENFVDVEWEFVNGDFYDPLFQRKLSIWGDNREQLLTVALCDTDSNRNFDRAFALPQILYRNGVTVLVHTERSEMIEKIHQVDGYHNLYPIGMNDCGYDVSLPVLQMAKLLNYFYTCSYGQEGAPTSMPVEKVEAAWRNLCSFDQRYSNIYNVMTITTKMRSLGHEEKDWNKFYALTQEEIVTLSAVEHNRWCVDRLMLGYRPPTDSEREEIRNDIQLKKAYKKKKIHYDLCAFRELREDETGKNARVYDYDLTACIPLIAQSFKENQP